MIFSSERDSRSDLYRVWLADRAGRSAHASLRRPRDHAERVARRQARRVCRADAAAPAVLGVPGPRARPRHRQDARARQQRRRLLAELVARRPTLANVLLAKEPSTLQVRNADGSGARELAADPKRWHYYPDWSKDGGWLALSVSPQHHEGEDWDLAIVAADGSRPLQQADDGPRQRPLARLEAVSNGYECRAAMFSAMLRGARRSSCHLHPQRLQPDPIHPGDRSPEAVHRRRHAGRCLLRHAQGLREPRHQTGPPDRPEHRRAAGAAHRRAARSAVLPRRRPRPGRRQDGAS